MNTSHPDLPNACPDCGGSLQPVQLFGRGPVSPISGAARDAAVIYYTDAGAERSAFLAMFEEKGRVEARMCASCRRIFLYGAKG
jgi:uncharacterized OB-fold protein